MFSLARLPSRGFVVIEIDHAFFLSFFLSFFFFPRRVSLSCARFVLVLGEYAWGIRVRGKWLVLNGFLYQMFAGRIRLPSLTFSHRIWSRRTELVFSNSVACMFFYVQWIRYAERKYSHCIIDFELLFFFSFRFV